MKRKGHHEPQFAYDIVRIHSEGHFKFFDEKLSKSSSTYNLEPGLYTSITDIVEAMNTLIQETNNHNET